jgi:hypothetical protein
MPTEALIASATASLVSRHPEIAGRIKVFVSESFGSPVSTRIVEFLKATPADRGVIMFITHEAFLRLPHWHLRQAWHLIVDEVLTVTYSESFTLTENKSKLIDLMTLLPEANGYALLQAADHLKVRAISENAKQDQVTAQFAALADKLMPRSQWQLYVRAGEFAKFVDGKQSQLEVHGLLHPAVLNGFRTVALIAANLRQSFMYRHFSKQGCEFREHTAIMKRLRYLAHENGGRLAIRYFTDKVWSKSLRDTQVDVDGRSVRVHDIYLSALRREFGSKPFLWIGNNDVKDVLEGGVRLPNVPHGLNEFQAFDQCAILSALNPTSGHRNFLKDLVGLSDRDVRGCLLSQVAYQAAGRGSLRNPDSSEFFLLLVPDRQTADDVAALYPGCQIEQLAEGRSLVLEKKSGRRRIHLSDAERKKAVKRRRQWKDKQASFSTSKGSFDPFVGGGFYHSLWRRPYHMDWVKQELLTTAEFFSLMEAVAQLEYSQKEHVPLFAPTQFRDQSAGHGKKNAVMVAGIVMDLDSTDMMPDDVATAVPECQMMIVSSWRHSPEDRRFRVLIPTTLGMSPEASEAIKRMIIRRFESAGFGGEPSCPRQHGVDMTKLHSASLFHYASKRPGGLLARFEQGRKPLDPLQWIETCPPDIVDRILGQVVSVTPPTGDEQIAFDGYTLPQREKFEIAIQAWRGHPPGQGVGNREFHRLGWRLHGHGMRSEHIEKVLVREAVWSASPSDRRRQISYVLADIERRG